MAGLGALGGGGLLGGQSLAALGAGLLAGVIGGGALVASGTVDFTPAATGGGGAAGGAGLELVPCPDQGPVIGSIPRNQQVLVTGRSEDSRWLEIYWPAPGLERDAAWTLAGPLQLEGDLASLPVTRCETPPTPTPRPTVEPTPTPVPTPTPTATPTPSPSPTPTGTPRPNAGPRLSGLAASTATISYDTDRYCASAAKSTVISVTATDADGIDSVMLHFRAPGAGSYAMKPMTLSGGRYVATLDTTADKLTTAGELRYYVSARDKDADAATTRTPRSGYKAVMVKVCKNTGPKVSASNRYDPIYWDPLGVGNCQTATDITATVSDVDGVDTSSIRLFFKRPGDGSYRSKAMVFNSGLKRWYANLDTLGDKILVKSPPSDSLTWYIQAKDRKGAATKTSARTIAIKRCDKAGEIFGPMVSPSSGGIGPGSFTSCGYPKITIEFWVRDEDIPSATAEIRWSFGKLSRAATAKRFGTDPPFYAGYRVAIATSSEWVPNLPNRLTLRISFKDVYGGTTTRTFPGVASYSACR